VRRQRGISPVFEEKSERGAAPRQLAKTVQFSVKNRILSTHQLTSAFLKGIAHIGFYSDRASSASYYFPMNSGGSLRSPTG